MKLLFLEKHSIFIQSTAPISDRRAQNQTKKYPAYLCRFTVGVPHLLLALLHVGEVVDDGLGEVLQPPQLHLQGLQLLHLGDLGGKRLASLQSAISQRTATPQLLLKGSAGAS